LWAAPTLLHQKEGYENFLACPMRTLGIRMSGYWESREQPGNRDLSRKWLL